MASETGGLVQNQNLNIHNNGFTAEASAGWKALASKAPRKGPTGRKPLGDLSNSLKPSVNQTAKKQNDSILSSKKETVASQATGFESKKKNTPNTSMKVQNSGRKALADISNSGKPLQSEASKKNYKAKLKAVAEERADPSHEGGFLHNHQECIKAQNRAMNRDEFLQTLGLDGDCFKSFATPRPHLVSAKGKAQTPLDQLKLAEMTEELFEDQSSKCKLNSKFGSPAPCKTPAPASCYMDWKDIDSVDFKLLETPELPKH